jgi:NAD(P)H-dependent FMN reductase
MQVFAFAGSLRRGSVNKKLVALAARKLEAKGVAVDHADFRAFEMPVYDGDLEDSDGIPAGARALADRIIAADGIVIGTPEYNFGVPGPLKNAVDWVSRIRPYPTNGKPGLLLSASPGLVGGSRGAIALRVSLAAMGMWLAGDVFSLARADQAFDESGALKDDGLDKRLDGTLDTFVSAVGSLRLG